MMRGVLLIQGISMQWLTPYTRLNATDAALEAAGTDAALEAAGVPQQDVG